MTDNLTDDEDSIWYEVDHENNIICLSANWDDRVLKQQTPELLSQEIMGKPLASFFLDQLTIMFVTSMLDSARLKQMSIKKPYRCDTPSLKRYMMMKVTPFDNDSVRVSHYLLKSIPWKYVTHFRASREHQPVIAQPEQKVVRCSLCNNVKHENDWITQDAFLTQNPKWIDQEIPTIYSLCERCK